MLMVITILIVAVPVLSGHQVSYSDQILYTYPAIDEELVVDQWFNRFIKQNYSSVYNFMINHEDYINTTNKMIYTVSKDVNITIFYIYVGGNVVSYTIDIRASNTNILDKLIGPNAIYAKIIADKALAVLKRLNGSTIKVLVGENETSNNYYWNGTVRGYSWKLNLEIKVNGKDIYYMGKPYVPPWFKDLLTYPKGYIDALSLPTSFSIEYLPGSPARTTITDSISFIAKILQHHRSDFNNIHWRYNSRDVINIMSTLIGRRLSRTSVRITYAYGLRDDRIIPIIIASFGNVTRGYSLLITCDDNKYYLSEWSPINGTKASIGSLRDQVVDESGNILTGNNTMNKVIGKNVNESTTTEYSNSSNNQTNHNLGDSQDGSMITYLVATITIAVLISILYIIGRHSRKQ